MIFLVKCILYNSSWFFLILQYMCITLNLWIELHLTLHPLIGKIVILLSRIQKLAHYYFPWDLLYQISSPCCMGFNTNFWACHVFHSQDWCSRPCLGCHFDDLSLDFYGWSICYHCFDIDVMVMMLLLDEICHWYMPWNVASSTLLLTIDDDDDITCCWWL